ncbi:MAG TPA: hypothetical protein VFO10_24575 [Oligoflexus sp.]|uniref:hypothetical protein n=1 Tax=Oligoflexus sp. TaxID=1971216 RepID=UPI002D7F4F60|nr:hypothetical protein [Oligoflexus sp.]HET9240463.1 hypothetical protein [Oligoflexus sp.]
MRFLMIATIIIAMSACCHDGGTRSSNVLNKEFKPNEDVQAPGTATRLMSDKEYIEAVKNREKKKMELRNNGTKALEDPLPAACKCCWIRSGNCSGPKGLYCLSENDGKQTFFCPSTGQVSTFQCIFIFGEGCYSLQDYSDTIIASPPPSKSK